MSTYRESSLPDLLPTSTYQEVSLPDFRPSRQQAGAPAPRREGTGSTAERPVNPDLRPGGTPSGDVHGARRAHPPRGARHGATPPPTKQGPPPPPPPPPRANARSARLTAPVGAEAIRTWGPSRVLLAALVGRLKYVHPKCGAPAIKRRLLDDDRFEASLAEVRNVLKDLEAVEDRYAQPIPRPKTDKVYKRVRDYTIMFPLRP